MAYCEKCKSSMVLIKSNSGAKHCMNCGWSSDDNCYKKTQTNADRIRAMSDEELAEFLSIVSDLFCIPTDGCMRNTFFRGECSKTNEYALKWLQSEVEE